MVDEDEDGEPIVSEGPIFCGRCNERIRGLVHTCCGITFHGLCFTNHRTKDHAGKLTP